jgi:hypothetical protein
LFYFLDSSSSASASFASSSYFSSPSS